MPSEIPAPNREELVKLRKSRMTREQIAEYYGVTLARVKRWIKELDIPPAATVAEIREKQQTIDAVELDKDYGYTLIERAQIILGKRMTEDYRGYLLDGRPVRVDFLVRAAGLSIPETN